MPERSVSDAESLSAAAAAISGMFSNVLGGSELRS